MLHHRYHHRLLQRPNDMTNVELYSLELAVALDLLGEHVTRQ